MAVDLTTGTSVCFRVGNQSASGIYGLSVYVVQGIFEVLDVAFNSTVVVSPKKLTAIREHWLTAFRLAGDPCYLGT